LHKENVTKISNATASKNTFANDRDLRTLAALLLEENDKVRHLAANLLDLDPDEIDLDALRDAVREALNTLYDRYGYHG
jgi:hypothetical protein